MGLLPALPDPQRLPQNRRWRDNTQVLIRFAAKIFYHFQTDNLKNGKFHQHLRDTFAPQVNFRLVSPISPQNCQYNIEFFFKIGYPVRWPDGELHRSVHPQGIREGKVGNQGVSEKSESDYYVGISGRRTGTNQNSGVCGEICRKVPRPCRGKPRYQKCFPSKKIVVERKDRSMRRGLRGRNLSFLWVSSSFGR